MQCRFFSKEPWQGRRRPLSGEHPGTPGRAGGKKGGRGRAEPLFRERDGKRGRVQSGREKRGETLQDIYAITPPSLTCLFLLSYGLSGLTFCSSHRDWDLLSSHPGQLGALNHHNPSDNNIRVTVSHS